MASLGQKAAKMPVFGVFQGILKNTVSLKCR
jgi:hypothetical protein